MAVMKKAPAKKTPVKKAPAKKTPAKKAPTKKAGPQVMKSGHLVYRGNIYVPLAKGETPK